MSANISVSILNLSFKNLSESLQTLKNIGIKTIHIDIIDTSFAQNISFGPEIINQILEFDFSFELHFMIENPLPILKKIRLDKVERITVHSHYNEVVQFVRTPIINHNINNKPTEINLMAFAQNNIPLKDCRNSAIKIGIALNPEDNIPDFTHFKPDHILVMTVNPGFGGQSLIKECVEKIKKIQEFQIEVGVDGGVNLENIHLVRHANYIVIGSALTKSENIGEYFDNLKKLL